VKRGTVVQEITADGRCVEHIHELPLIVDPVQERIDNLPEFRRMREQSLKSAAEIIEDNDAMQEQERQAELEQEMNEYQNEEAQFRKQIEKEQKEIAEEGRNIKKRDKSMFEEAMQERKSMDSFAPKIKVRVLEKKKDAKPSRPEPVFIRKKAKPEPEKEEETKNNQTEGGSKKKEEEQGKKKIHDGAGDSKKEVEEVALPFGLQYDDSDSES